MGVVWGDKAPANLHRFYDKADKVVKPDSDVNPAEQPDDITNPSDSPEFTEQSVTKVGKLATTSEVIDHMAKIAPKTEVRHSNLLQ